MRSVRFAIRSSIPITFSYIFVGLAFGIMINESGKSLLWLTAASTLIYAGSMQIVLISLLTSGVPLYVIAIMTFVINSRHIFYGISFIDRFKGMGWLYPYMILTLTDETYSVMCSLEYPEDVKEPIVDFTIAFFMHMLWIFSTVAGYLFGEIVPLDLSGIEFSAVTFFVCVVVSQWLSFDSHLPAITGAMCAAVFLKLMGPKNFILPALSVSVIVLIIVREFINYRSRGVNIE